MKRSTWNKGYLHFALLLLLLCGVVQSSSTQAASSRQAAAQEQTEPDGSLPDAAQQIYLPLAQGGSAGDAIWSDVTESVVAVAASARQVIPQKYRTVRLDVSALQQLLQATPQEASAAAQRAQVILSLPLPDGTFGRFRIVEAPIMAPELAAKFPEIKTYAGQGIDDPTATVRFDWTPAGFHAQILAVNGAVYIDPYSRNDTVHYISYFKRDLSVPANLRLKEPPLSSTDKARSEELAALREGNQAQSAQAAAAVGTQLRTYRLAMASNGEHTQLVGGTIAAAMADIATTVNRLTGIYEKEVAIRFQLVANNDLLIYTDPNTDPYTESDTVVMLGENQTNLDAVIGNANYDIGHVLHTGGGGVASSGVVCFNDAKGRGNSGAGAGSVGDPFIVDFVAHEIGHQFSAGHIFNVNIGDCGSNRGAATAYEPGSGSTIMSYAGVCGAQDLQPHNDPFFNTASFDQIVDYSTLGDGNSCPVITNTGNTPPVVNAGAGGFTIPRQTPFTLTGSATDADGDALTYSWEGHDPGDADGSLANNPLEAPFFRSFPPVTSPSRTFPKWSDIVNNTNTIGEILPNVSRTLNFRLTARDNRSGGGGVNYASISFNVTTAAGPFLVTAPNTAVSWTGGSTQNVTWDVANTNAAPVNCTGVNVLLSTDGGFTYPTTLASNVPNNGSASVTVPNIATTTARVQVACANNIFFDISNTDFTIAQAPPATGTIIIRKATNPAGGTGFGFTSNIPSNTSFTLNHNQNRTINSVAVGSYTVSENSPSGYSLTNLVCTDPSGGTTTNLGTRTATIGLAAGETVDCTFTNTQTGATPAIVISSDINGSVPGLSFRDEDIIAYSSGTWSLVFDGSDVGLGNVDVDGFAFLSNGQLLLSVDKDFTLSGFGPVDESDILKFIPSSYGSTTSGSYQMYFDGSDVGLSSSDEDVDAIDFDASGNLLISVNGAFKAQSVTGADEDLFALSGFTPGANTVGTWSLYFDGSDVGLTSSGEDIFGLWADHANSKLYLTTRDTFAVPGASGDEDDIFVCHHTSLGATTACTFTVFWNGDNFGFDEDAIDGLSIGNPPAVNACVTTADASTTAEELAPECLVEAESEGSIAVDDTVEYEGDDANEADPLDGEETAAEEAQPNRIFLPLAQQ